MASNGTSFGDNFGADLPAGVRELLEEQVKPVQDGIVDLEPAFLLNIMYAAVAEWEQATGLAADALLRVESPLFRLVHLKLIFQMFEVKVQEFLHTEEQRDVLHKFQDVFFERFQGICRDVE